VSQSPDQSVPLDGSDGYLKNFDALAAMISRGRSFSGHERNCVFLNTGDDRFSDVSSAIALDFIDDGRALAMVDWDHDGDLDLWIANRTAPRIRFAKNDIQTPNHYLAIKLEGRTANRDAIGARVELYLNGKSRRRVIKTVRAGDCFLSQSSKWLHFGLGTSDQIEQLTVRWPGTDQAETIGGLEVDRRYKIVEGTGQAVAQDGVPRAAVLKPSEPTLPRSTDRARLFLTHRQTLPDLAYVDFQGERGRFQPAPGHALLVSLWASWCAPCLEELSQLAAHERELRDQGLELLALSTDGLTASAAGDVEAAKTLLSRTKWPFAAGVATERTVRALTLLDHQAVYRERPLPLPTSFLVDSENQVAAIYKGPVSLDELWKDLQLLDAPPERIAAAAFPFPGQTIAPRFSTDILDVARSYLEGGYLDEAKGDLVKYIEQNAASAGAGDQRDSPSARKKLAEVYHLLATLEKQRGQLDEAVAAFRQVVKLDPQEPAPRVSLALALWEQNNRPGAHDELDELFKLGPDSAEVLNLLGHTYTQLGELDRAIDYYRRASERQPNSYVLRFNLAVALQTSGRAEEAIGHYREVLRQEPKAVHAANNLAWILATHDDERLRDAAEALRLAGDVAKVTGEGQPSVLDTLAAALAASGQFDKAVGAAEKALALARAQNQTELAGAIHGRLELYRQSKAYRQPIAK
jgi:tetratricopeptide (TPR) repeat protein